MSEYIDTGVLFKNNKKTTDKQPDYTGELNIRCQCGRTFTRLPWTR
jgi:hypothetical protein